ncbi:hypothetical protein GWI33_020309 [Rhynchophorus ferrugineus]|uniref:Kinesin motor domain-containing protein n=1 Tax=Rhynchophorus ferrugineus TaxID=354439 RepID=A0A834LZI1_RHYFE|nr:hypothetical protein GWI33_020309 [Rhynchophorus ferrugineus]
MHNTDSTQMVHNIPVYLRIKGSVKISGLYKISDDTIVCNVPGGHVEQTKEKYLFSKIFKTESTQKIYDVIIKEEIVRFINGKNFTLIVYGSSGSGSSFTLYGTQKEPGIIPRSIVGLFRSLPPLQSQPHFKPLPDGQVLILHHNQKLLERQRISANLKYLRSRKTLAKGFRAMNNNISKDRSYTKPIGSIINVYITFCEIYNENIFDLFQPISVEGHSRQQLETKECEDNIYIKDLTSVYVSSALEVYELLEYGLQNRNDAIKAAYLESSKSHCLFTVKLIQGHRRKVISVSSFTFSHLEGPERLEKRFDEQYRLMEINCIKRSMSILKRCITMIRDGEKNKDNIKPLIKGSKISQLFQRALLRQEHIQLMVNINPASDMLSSTLRSLNFFAIAKGVVDRTTFDLPCCSRQLNFFDSSQPPKEETIKALKNECEMLSKKNNKNSDENKSLKEEIIKLRLQLSKEKSRCQQAVDEERKNINDSYGKIIGIKEQQIEILETNTKILFEEVLNLRQHILNNNQTQQSSNDFTCSSSPNQNVQYDRNCDSVITISDDETMKENFDEDNHAVNNENEDHINEGNISKYYRIPKVSEVELMDKNIDEGPSGSNNEHYCIK